jgi:hypothetical protein
MRQYNNSPEWLLNRLSLHAIIELFAVHPPDILMDCSELMWLRLEEELAPEDFDRVDILKVEVILEQLMHEYYFYLENILGVLADRYVFDRWIGQNTFLIRMEERYIHK